MNAYFNFNGNASKAAAETGYEHPYSQGWRLANTPEIAAEIKRRMNEKAMTADEIVARLADIGRGSLEDFLEIDEHGFTKLNLAKAKAAGQLHLLKTYEYSRQTGLKIALHDPKAALDSLSRISGLEKTRIEHSGSVSLLGLTDAPDDTLDTFLTDATSKPDSSVADAR